MSYLVTGKNTIYNEIYTRYFPSVFFCKRLDIRLKKITLSADPKGQISSNSTSCLDSKLNVKLFVCF